MEMSPYDRTRRASHDGSNKNVLSHTTTCLQTRLITQRDGQHQSQLGIVWTTFSANDPNGPVRPKSTEAKLKTPTRVNRHGELSNCSDRSQRLEINNTAKSSESQRSRHCSHHTSGRVCARGDTSRPQRQTRGTQRQANHRYWFVESPPSGNQSPETQETKMISEEHEPIKVK